MHTSKTFSELNVGEAFVRAMAKRYVVCVKTELVNLDKRSRADDDGKRNAVIILEHAGTFAPDCGALLFYRDCERVNVIELKPRRIR